MAFERMAKVVGVVDDCPGFGSMDQLDSRDCSQRTPWVGSSLDPSHQEPQPLARRRRSAVDERRGSFP
jgi:hypothetical protein